MLWHQKSCIQVCLGLSNSWRGGLLDVLRRGVGTLVLLLFSLGSSQAQSSREADEYSVKAVFLLNFAKFTEWPEGLSRRQAGVFSICSWKSELLSASAAALEKKGLPPLTVRVLTIHEYSEIPNCDVLYVPEFESNNTTTVLSQLSREHSVLTVTEDSGSGILSFKMNDGQVKFECNLREARASKIVLSSQLIKLAVHVEGETTS